MVFTESEFTGIILSYLYCCVHLWFLIFFLFAGSSDCFKTGFFMGALQWHEINIIRGAMPTIKYISHTYTYFQREEHLLYILFNFWGKRKKKKWKTGSCFPYIPMIHMHWPEVDGRGEWYIFHYQVILTENLFILRRMSHKNIRSWIIYIYIFCF